MLSVYVVHWNAPEWCAASVRTILRSDVGVRVTVIDNGESELTVPPNVRVLHQATNRGYTGGANAALRDWLQRDGDQFCIIGSHDLHVEPQTFSRLLAAAETYPDAGILGPHFTSEASEGGRILGERTGAEIREWISGTCLMIRRECAEAVGEFDERFGSYVEDADYCMRAADMGWKVLSVADAAAHGLGAASKRSRIMRYSNSVLLVTKRRGAAAGLREVAAQFVAAGWHVREALRPESHTDYELSAASDRLRAIPGALRQVYRCVRTRRER
jgi:GT2 family glycosyltransferase